MTEFRLKLVLTLALIGIDAIWIALGHFTFDLTSLMGCVAVTAAMSAIGYVYTRLRPDPRLGTMGTETAFLMAASAAGAILSYLVTTLDLPLIDGTLAKVDEALGFDWHAYIAFANAHVWVGQVSSLVYISTLYQIALTVVLLPAIGHADRAREMTLLVIVSSFLCVAVSGVLPSAGALAWYHPDASFYMQNHPIVDMSYKQVFFDLRAGRVTHLSLEDVHGLVAFPSYHVGLSVILMIAYRGIRKLFWPVAALNLLVILSTPIDGGHHLSDALGGAALAVISAVIVVKLRGKLRKPEPQPENAGLRPLAGQQI